MSVTKPVAMNKKQIAELDRVLRSICKKRKCAVEADLEVRTCYRERDPKHPKQASWLAYARFLLSDGHTVYVPLRNMSSATVSAKVDKFAQGKVEKRLARQKKRAAKKMPVVKFNSKLSTLDAAGKTTKGGK